MQALNIKDSKLPASTTDTDGDVNSRTTVRMGPSGFDAKLLRDQFRKKAKYHPVKNNDIAMVFNNTVFYNYCQPKRDLIMFISLFVKYGNNIQKALKESDSVGSSVIRIKCDLYGVDTGETTVYSTKRGLKHDQLSLTRIALAFPTHSALMILEKKLPGILQFSTFFQQQLPLVMQHTIFPGLIPAKHFTDELKGIALILNVEESVKLSGCKDIGTIRETFGEMIEASVKYIDAAINNDIEDERKLKILKEAGIIDVKANDEFELSAATVVFVNKLEGIKALYPLEYQVAVREAKGRKRC